MCRGRGVCKLVHHHIPNTKLTQRDDNIIASRVAISYLHTDTRASVLQYYVACKGLNVTAMIHTAHAQKHFPPETKSKVRPKKNSHRAISRTPKIGSDSRFLYLYVKDSRWKRFWECARARAASAIAPAGRTAS